METTLPAPVQTLSFRLRIARTEEDIMAACRLRAESYARRQPELFELLSRPDELDSRPDCAVFLCVDKATNAPVGTMRVQSNALGPLVIESNDEIAAAVPHVTRAEITRNATRRDADLLVRTAMMKASYLYCIANQIRLMVVGVKSPGLLREYRRGLQFTNLFEDNRKVALAHGGGVPHEILVGDMMTAERRWREAGNRLYDFMISTWHPDIELFTLQPALRATTGRTEQHATA